MKRTNFIAGLVFLILVIFVLPSRWTGPLEETYAFTARPFLSLFTSTARTLRSFARFGSVVEENRVMRSKLDHFRRLAFEREDLKSENDRLRQLLDFKARTGGVIRKAIPCQVIGRSPAAWRESIVLNRGHADGIRPEMPVMSYAGLLGKVTETTERTASVRLISHPRFRVGVLIQRTRHTGVVFGSAHGECRMKYISMDADVQAGDAVETAGFSEEFPKGLLIGTVDAIWKEPGQLYRVASVRLAADLDRLEEVLCVVP